MDHHCTDLLYERELLRHPLYTMRIPLSLVISIVCYAILTSVFKKASFWTSLIIPIIIFSIVYYLIGYYIILTSEPKSHLQANLDDCVAAARELRSNGVPIPLNFDILTHNPPRPSSSATVGYDQTSSAYDMTQL